MAYQDPTPAQVAALRPGTRDKAIHLINALRSVGVPAIIGPLGGKRTIKQQLQLYGSGRGVTTTVKSRHIYGAAFDIDVAGMNRDDVPKWWWPIIGQYAESVLKLRWGGRWTRPYDPGHFED